jgi:hypothetical protein
MEFQLAPGIARAILKIPNPLREPEGTCLTQPSELPEKRAMIRPSGWKFESLVEQFKFFSEKNDEKSPLFFTSFSLQTQVKNFECFHHFFVFKVKILKEAKKVLQKLKAFHLLFQ